MKQNLTSILILCIIQLNLGCSQLEKSKTEQKEATKIELKDNWYYLNGE